MHWPWEIMFLMAQKEDSGLCGDYFSSKQPYCGNKNVSKCKSFKQN